MNYCRVSRKGSGVVFGRRVFHVDGRYPKTTPDPVRVAYLLNKSDSYFFADPKLCHKRGLTLSGHTVFLGFSAWPAAIRS
jgi:hypothetical protein